MKISDSRKKTDIVSINDYTKQDLEKILHFITLFDNSDYPDLLRREMVGTLFLEASTRTHLSFLSAAQRLGAQTLRFPYTNSSFQHKQESFIDTLQVLQQYVDVLILRHNLEGSARLAADILSIPVINAGDGSNQHPTQTFVDLYTLHKHCKSLHGIKIAFVGDLRFGRTVHSLITALQHYNCTMYFVSPDNLSLPYEYQDMLHRRNLVYRQSGSIQEVLPHVDFVYMTRFQRERFADDEEFTIVESDYAITLPLISTYARKELKVMHPLPRGREIDHDVDSTGHNLYFDQVRNGLTTRKSLLALVLDKKGAM